MTVGLQPYEMICKALKEGYERAREMLKPTPYPVNKNGYPELIKSRAMKTSAEYMNNLQLFRHQCKFPGRCRSWGIEQHKCNNYGDCVTGCNHSAKNTLIIITF
jgi:cholesterol oxidase